MQGLHLIADLRGGAVDRAPSTCAKHEEDGCDDVDVRLQIAVRQSNLAWTRSEGVGACGC